MRDTWAYDDVIKLVTTVVAGIRTGDNGDDRVYSLKEVADRTGFALNYLETGCRNNTIEHTRVGRTIGLTSRQIALIVTAGRHGRTEAATTEKDELAAVREASLKSGAARAPRGRQRVST